MVSSIIVVVPNVVACWYKKKLCMGRQDCFFSHRYRKAQWVERLALQIGGFWVQVLVMLTIHCDNEVFT